MIRTDSGACRRPIRVLQQQEGRERGSPGYWRTGGAAAVHPGGPGGGDRHRARLRPGPPGCHRGRHRAAGHRAGFPRQRGQRAVGGGRLHADPGRAAAARRDAGRQLRPAEDVRDRHRVVRGGVAAVRAGAERSDADRGAGPAGGRRGAADPRQPGDPAGVVRAEGPFGRDRRVVRARRGGHRDRAVPGGRAGPPRRRPRRGRRGPGRRSPGPVPRLDVKGAVCISGALAGITYGLIAASADGWGSVQVLIPLAAGLVLGGLFILAEAIQAQPMLPLGVFASRQFSAANAVTFVVYAALGGLLFLVPTVLQVARGYSPVEAGTSLLPVTVIMLALSSRSGALAARIGPRLQMSVGPLVIAGSLLLFTRIGSSGDYLTAVLPAVVVFGLGVAINVAPLTATALAAAPADHAGVASAVNNDVARAAGLIAVAVLPALAGITGDSYLHPAALAHGFKVAAMMAAAFCAVGGVLAAFTIRNPPRAAGAKAPPLESSCGLEAPPLRSLDRIRPTEVGDER